MYCLQAAEVSVPPSTFGCGVTCASLWVKHLRPQKNIGVKAENVPWEGARGPDTLRAGTEWRYPGSRNAKLPECPDIGTKYHIALWRST